MKTIELRISYRRLTTWDWWNGGVKTGPGVWTWVVHLGPLALALAIGRTA